MEMQGRGLKLAPRAVTEDGRNELGWVPGVKWGGVQRAWVQSCCAGATAKF